MRTKIVAVTVGEHYYLRGQFCIKYLGIGKRLDYTRFWHVKSSDCSYYTFDNAENKAIEYGLIFMCPYFQDVKHGQVVTQKQIDELEKYGVTV